jgi:hypothetical protein
MMGSSNQGKIERCMPFYFDTVVHEINLAVRVLHFEDNLLSLHLIKDFISVHGIRQGQDFVKHESGS